MSVNKVILLGHIGQIEIKSFDGQNGPRKCATFSFATTERYKDRTGNYVNNTEWHNLVCWRQAEFVEKYITKGAQVYVEGKLRTRSWEKDGEKRYVTEILVNEIQPLDRKKDNQSAPQTSQQKFDPHAVQTTPMPVVDDMPDDDMPF